VNLTVELGKLTFVPVAGAGDLVGGPVRRLLVDGASDGLWVSDIDPGLADTAAFCEEYGIGLDVSANCVVVEARRAERTWYAACLVLATTRADINGVVRKHLGARKISFAAMETAVSHTDMEYGGITPIGLPEGWPILIDRQVIDQPRVIIGSGVRGSKLLAETGVLATLPGAEILEIAKPA
jgi:prolyl-tRNA editing enzyme YbaK/EbsC (Cys-tRNA(Pro) deacylase)